MDKYDMIDYIEEHTGCVGVWKDWKDENIEKLYNVIKKWYNERK